jgi:hypothetical protein
MTTHGIDKNKDPLKYVVLAGNLREHQNWCADNGVRPAEALFVATSQVLYGRRFPPTTKIIIVGTFHARNDSREIMAMVQSRLPGKL